MPVFKGEVSVKVTVDVSIEAKNLAEAKSIAADIYATSSCPDGVNETGEFCDPFSVFLIEDFLIEDDEVQRKKT